ncbi:MAG: response regulator transcription factor [Methylotenera sp.]|nr:response regulator transcription factor [Methylotenera sp.]
MAAYKVLIADDHKVIRQGVRSLFESAGYEVVAEADSGESAYMLWQKNVTDLIVLDLNMPGSGGLEVARKMIARNQQVRILIYSMFEDPVHVSRAFQAGVQGYVAKTDDPALILEASKQILKGKRFISPLIANQVTQQYLFKQPSLSTLLTSREFEVFRRLALGNPLAQIASELNISNKSVANLQTRIRQKLNITSQQELFNFARAEGILAD